jgi:hypothetical protein
VCLGRCRFGGEVDVLVEDGVVMLRFHVCFSLDTDDFGRYYAKWGIDA